MTRSIHTNGDRKNEGYLYHSYGDQKYLRHVVASVSTLRRYDRHRPVTLAADTNQLDQLRETGLDRLFDQLIPLPENHQSITGFKHNLHHYTLYSRTLFLDSDIIWCKNPDSLWASFSAYPFTITGLEVSDNFFGSSKNVGVIFDILFQRRKRTLKRFGLTHLSRVQSGMIYAADSELTRKVCERSAELYRHKKETHFHSRLQETGRSEESCEWSMAMAMSQYNLSVYLWFQGDYSPQLDFIDSYTRFDESFREVRCLYYGDPFVYSFRGLKQKWLRQILVGLFGLIPGKGDYRLVTPYTLHFGWIHQKKPFYQFADREWEILRSRQEPERTEVSFKE